jgi:hypothetical protein
LPRRAEPGGKRAVRALLETVHDSIHRAAIVSHGVGQRRSNGVYSFEKVSIARAKTIQLEQEQTERTEAGDKGSLAIPEMPARSLFVAEMPWARSADLTLPASVSSVFTCSDRGGHEGCQAA